MADWNEASEEARIEAGGFPQSGWSGWVSLRNQADAEFICLARKALPWWIAEAERLRAENATLRDDNAHLQRINDVMGEEWREGLSTTWDCIRLIRRALADGMTPELRQEMSEATTLNVHGESGQVEQLRRENAELKQQLGDALVATHNTVATLRGELMRAQASPTARLEVWRSSTDEPGREWGLDAWCLHLQQYTHSVYVHASPSHAALSHWKSPNAIIVGTDEQPATLDEMILAAMAKWEELYGE